jgi:hypothetical protein
MYASNIKFFVQFSLCPSEDLGIRTKMMKLGRKSSLPVRLSLVQSCTGHYTDKNGEYIHFCVNVFIVVINIK